VDFLAAMHLRAAISLGDWKASTVLAEYYERLLLGLPAGHVIRNHTLCLIYFLWGWLRALMSTADGHYNFAQYFSKMDDYSLDPPLALGKLQITQCGPWANLIGSAKREAMQEYISATSTAVTHVNRDLDIPPVMALGELINGELKFYQGNVEAADPFIRSAVDLAKESGDFEILHRSLLYAIRIAILQGKGAQAEQTLKEIEALLDEKRYYQRFTMVDIARGWYYCALRQMDRVPGWLKEKFSPYSHAIMSENFGNQIKARYYFLTKNFAPLLAYIDEMKRRESVLFGRIEMLAIEACVRYQMKDGPEASKALLEAYKTASPNDITMPFIELGKDMRTLVLAAMRDDNCEIPRAWLELIKRKSAYYAKNQGLLITAYERTNNTNREIDLSSREREVLRDLYNGLSQSEIATKYDLSVKTIEMVNKNILGKLHAHSKTDVIRIASEKNLV